MSERLRILPFVLVVTALAGCGDDGNGPPTKPEDPDPTPAQVDSIAILPAGAAIEEGDTVQLSAEVYDVSGETLTDVEVSWSSDDASIASVGEAGVVTAEAKGRASITASVEGVSDAATVKVRTGATVVVDATELKLVRDSAERADGLFRFDVKGGSTPELEAGDIIVGVEQGGYLRRVTEVVTLTANVVEVRTEQATLAAAIDSGSFQATIPINSGSSSSIGQNGLAVGPSRAVGFPTSITPTGGALVVEDHVLVSREVCFEAEDGTACADVSLTLPSGRIGFTPELELGGKISLDGVEEFEAIAVGNLDFDLAADLSATGEVEFGDEHRLSQGFITTPFTIPGPLGIPIVGEWRLEFLVGYDVTMDAEGSVGSAVDTDYETRVGVRYEAPEWSMVQEQTPGFEVEPITVDLEGGATARIWVRPQMTIVLYRTLSGNTNLTPFLEGNALLADECTFDLSAGLDAGVGFRATVLAVELASFERSLNLISETLVRQSIDCGLNAQPAVEITRPSNDSTIIEGESITFEGSAEDPEDGTLTGDALVWSSDLDGEMGTGTAVTTSSLSVGTHEITLTATDSEGSTGTDQITITVEGTSATPSVTDIVPINGSGQIAVAGEELPEPIQFKVIDEEERGVAYETVTFTVPTANGDIAAATATTDLDGIVSTTLSVSEAASIGEAVTLKATIERDDGTTVTGAVNFGVRRPMLLYTRIDETSGAFETVLVDWLDQTSEIVSESGVSNVAYATSPDGSRVAMSRGNSETALWELWLHEWKSGTSFRIYEGSADDTHGIDPTWSPDGRLVAFEIIGDLEGSFRGTSCPERRVRIGLYDVTTGEVITTDLLPDVDCAYSPEFVDSNTVVTAQPSPDQLDLWAHDVETGSATKITSTETVDEWAPARLSDTRLVFTCREPEPDAEGLQRDICAQNIDGTDRTNITSSPELEVGPTVSHSGELVAFEFSSDIPATSRADAAPWDIVTAPISGGTYSQVPGVGAADERSAEFGLIGWDPDGLSVDIVPSMRAKSFDGDPPLKPVIPAAPNGGW